MRKPVFGVFDQVRLKPVYSASETSYGPEILDLASKGYWYYSIWAANNKGADETARRLRKLIWAFVV